MDINGIIQGQNAVSLTGNTSRTADVAATDTSGGQAKDLFAAILQRKSSIFGASNVETEISRTLLKNLDHSADPRERSSSQSASSRPTGPKPQVVDRTAADTAKTPKDDETRASDKARAVTDTPHQPVPAESNASVVEATTFPMIGLAMAAPPPAAPIPVPSGSLDGLQTTAPIVAAPTTPSTPVLAAAPPVPDQPLGNVTPGVNSVPATDSLAQAATRPTDAPNPAFTPNQEQGFGATVAALAVKDAVVLTSDTGRNTQAAKGSSAGTGSLTAPTGTGNPAPTATAQTQAAELARSLDPEASLDVRVRVTGQGSAEVKPAQIAGQETLRPVTQTGASPDFGAGQQAMRDGSAFFQNASGSQTTVLQQAQANIQGQPGQSPVASQQAPVPFEQQLAERQATNASNARADAVKAEQATESAQAGGRVGAPNASQQARPTAEPVNFQVAAAQAGRTADSATQIEQAARTEARSHTPEAQRVMDQIKVNISKALDRGVDHIRIQLRPTSLGRVEVKMDMDSSGQIKATIIADKPETLEMLRGDQRSLERALQDAGLKTSEGGLNFELRGEQQATAGQERGSGKPGGGSSGLGEVEDADDALLDPDGFRSRRALERGGVDVRI